MFNDVRLPTNIERGAKGGPQFKTSIILFSTGKEQRNIEWERSRSEWDIGYSVQSREQYQEVLKFFYARRGRAFGFRFKDWSDYKATEQLVGTIVYDVDDNPITDTFQLTKTYFDYGDPYVRKITRPVEETMNVFIDEVATDNWTLLAGGKLKLGSTTMDTIAEGAEITVTFEFDVPVRFDIDKMDLTLEWVNLGDVDGITIVEIQE